MDFAETSFLYSFYRRQNTSPVAITYMEKHGGGIATTSLVLFEFRQSVRLQARLFAQDRTKGFPQREADTLLDLLAADVSAAVWRQVAFDWPAVHEVAEVLSAQHTRDVGCRFADILHVATALVLGARTFLTFDPVQRRLARAAKLETPLRV